MKKVTINNGQQRRAKFKDKDDKSESQIHKINLSSSDISNQQNSKSAKTSLVENRYKIQHLEIFAGQSELDDSTNRNSIINWGRNSKLTQKFRCLNMLISVFFKISFLIRYLVLATLLSFFSVVNAHTLYKCPSGTPDCTADASSEIITETTGCERTTASSLFENGRYSAETQTSHVLISASSSFNPISTGTIGWTCPQQQTGTGVSYESDEMNLCGFQHSTGDLYDNLTGDQFDAFRAIFCHKYDSTITFWIAQFSKVLGNVPGDKISANNDPECFLGQGNCYEKSTGDDPDGNNMDIRPCWGDLICGTNDQCECVNSPICPYYSLVGGWADLMNPTYTHSEVKCDNGQFVNSVQFDTATFQSIKFRCSSLDGSGQSDFKTVGTGTNNGDVYTTSGSHFCGVRATYGATSATSPTSFEGLIGLDLMLCESYDCRDKLTITANSLEDRTYKVVPQNADFEKPAIGSILVQNAVYDQTQDQSDYSLNKISHYFTNTDNVNCPINSCELMESCSTSPTPMTSDPTLIWAPTNSEMIAMAVENAVWDTVAGATHIFHVNTDPTQLFSYSDLCIQCKNIDKYGNSDATITSNAFNVEIQCKDGIAVSMADQYTGSLGESSLINLENQEQVNSDDTTLKPKFNVSSFLTSTKACPVDFYQVSLDFYDDSIGAANTVSQIYYSFPTGIIPFDFTDSDEVVYSNQNGPIDIDETPSPTVSGTVSNGLYSITVADGENPATYSFKIKAWVLGGLSTYVSPVLTLVAKCPTFTGNLDELDTISLSNHLTWIGAPSLQSTYTMNSAFMPRLPKCLSIMSYEAVQVTPSGILSYPASSCITSPCLSWDIDSSVAYTSPAVTFIIRATNSYGQTYDSSQIQITINADSNFSPTLDPSTSNIGTADGVFMIGDTRLFEIDQFEETSFNLGVTNYFLTTDLTTVTQSLSAPGCNSNSFLSTNVAGTLQTNGKIGFVIDTSSLQSPCQVRVYAQLDLFSTLYEFSSTTSIQVVCGAETISMDGSLSLQEHLIYSKGESTVLSPYSLSISHITGLAIFSSNQVDCPITSFERDSSTTGCSPQSRITMTGQTLTYDASQGFQETVCIKALTNAVTDSPILFTLKVTVCGNEGLNPASLGASQTSFLLQKGEPNTINFDSSWFIEDATNSDVSCFSPLTYYELATGSDCLGAPDITNFILSTTPKQITMTTVNPMATTILCLKATTKGQVTASQQLTVEICGDEDIYYSRSLPFTRYFTFDKTITSQVQVVSLATLGFNFATSRVNCPISFKFVQQQDNGQESDFTGPELSIDQSSGEISVDTSIPMALKGFVTAYSYNSNTVVKSDMIYIEVCGFETVIVADAMQVRLVQDQGLKYSTESYQAIFESGLNNTNCSFTGYELTDIVGNPLSLAEAKDFAIEEGKVKVNTSLDVELHNKELIQGSYYLWYFQLQGQTRGLKTFQVPLSIVIQVLDLTGFSIGDFDIQFDLNGIFQKIESVSSVVNQDIDPDYIIMLEELFVPSLTFDQPNDLEWDNSTEITAITAELQMEIFDELSEEYSQNNPQKRLPMNELNVAFYEGLSFMYSGILQDGSIYSDSTLNLIDAVNEDDDIDQSLGIQFDEGGDSVDFDWEFNNETETGLRPTRMKFKEIDVKYDDEMIMFAQVQFDKNIKPFNDTQINLIKNALFVSVQSRVDGSQLKGIHMPNTTNETRQLCSGSACEVSEFDFKTYDDESEVSVSESKLQFQWQYWNISQDSIFLKLNFQYPHNVSRNSFGQDEFRVTIKDDQLILDKENSLTLDNESIGTQFIEPMKPRPANPETVEMMTETIGLAASLIIVIVFGSYFGNMVLGKALGQVWGVLNTQIILIHLILFRCQTTTPANIYTFNSLLSKMTFTSKDTYEIPRGLFDFSPKASPIAHMEILGYVGANFVTTAGSLPINILQPIMMHFFWMAIKKITYRCKYRFGMRWIGSYLSTINPGAAVAPMYVSSYLDLVVCAVISAKELSSKDFDGSNKSDRFAAFYLIVALLVLISSPVLTMYIVYKNRDKVDDPEVIGKFGFIYSGLKAHNWAAANYTAFVMLRKFMFVIIIIHMYEFSGLQLMADLCLSMSFLMYVGFCRPYSDQSHNRWEIFNESCGIVVRYFLLWLAIFPDFDVGSLGIIDTIGWCYVGACSFNICVAGVKVFIMSILSIPGIIQKYINMYKERQYQLWKGTFLAQKKFIKLDLATNEDKHFHDEAIKIVKLEQYRQAVEKLKEQHQKEQLWMIQGKINDERYKQLLHKSQTKDRDILQKLFLGYVHDHLLEMKFTPVRLSVGDMLAKTLPHNDTTLLTVMPPYKERKYIAIQDQCVTQTESGDKDLLFGKIPTKEEVRSANRKVFVRKQVHLLRFLQDEEYMYIRITKDGNCGPRALSLWIWGAQLRHKELRENIYQSKLKNLKEAHKEDLDRSVFESKLEGIVKMRENKVWFTDEELQECSNLYNFEIIIFSLMNNMRFMDTIISPSVSCDKKPTVPLYLLHHDFHFTLLIHKAQPNLKQFYINHGRILRPFFAKDFKLDEEQLINALKDCKFEFKWSTHRNQKVDEGEQIDTRCLKSNDQKVKRKKKPPITAEQSLSNTTKMLQSKQLLTVEVITEENEESLKSSVSAESPATVQSKKSKGFGTVTAKFRMPKGVVKKIVSNNKDRIMRDDVINITEFEPTQNNSEKIVSKDKKIKKKQTKQKMNKLHEPLGEHIAKLEKDRKFSRISERIQLQFDQDEKRQEEIFEESKDEESELIEIEKDSLIDNAMPEKVEEVKTTILTEYEKYEIDKIKNPFLKYNTLASGLVVVTDTTPAIIQHKRDQIMEQNEFKYSEREETPDPSSSYSDHEDTPNSPQADGSPFDIDAFIFEKELGHFDDTQEGISQYAHEFYTAKGAFQMKYHQQILKLTQSESLSLKTFEGVLVLPADFPQNVQHKLKQLTKEDLKGMRRMQKVGVKQLLGVNIVQFYNNHKLKQKQEIKNKKRIRYERSEEVVSNSLRN